MRRGLGNPNLRWPSGFVRGSTAMSGAPPSGARERSRSSPPRGPRARAHRRVPASTRRAAVAAGRFLPAATGRRPPASSGDAVVCVWSGDAVVVVWWGDAAAGAWWDGARAVAAWSDDAVASADASSPARARRASPRGRARKAQRGAFECPWRGFSLPSENRPAIGSAALWGSEPCPTLDRRHLQCLVALRGPAQTPLLHWLFRMHGAPEGCTRARPLRQIPPWQ